jgi:stage V sporulation protein R
MATSPTRLNPYKLGIELLKDIEDRWNKGQFGKDWDECDDLREKENWHKDLNLGRKKIFDVRRIYNDVTFIDEFLTEDFCRRHKMFSFAYNDVEQEYEIESREFKQIKHQLLRNLTNYGRPVIHIVEANYHNRGELLLEHSFEGIELQSSEAKDTLVNLHIMWGRPVHIKTVIDDKPALISFNGQVHQITN